MGTVARRQIAEVVAEANGYVQALHDKFTAPLGHSVAPLEADETADTPEKMTA